MYNKIVIRFLKAVPCAVSAWQSTKILNIMDNQPMPVASKNMPTGVKIIAVLYIICGVFLIIAGIGIASGSGLIGIIGITGEPSDVV